MSTNFERTESGELRIKFTTQEAQVLINLLEQLLELLGEPLICCHNVVRVTIHGVLAPGEPLKNLMATMDSFTTAKSETK